MTFDPPNGAKYGFPKEIKESDDIEKILRESGYPEKDIEYAIKYGRCIYDGKEGE